MVPWSTNCSMSSQPAPDPLFNPVVGVDRGPGLRLGAAVSVTVQVSGTYPLATVTACPFRQVKNGNAKRYP